MGIDLYYMPISAPCRSVIMACKELNIELNLKPLNLMAKEQLTPEFLKINPQHCIPTLDDNGFVLWESRAILTYLVNKYSPGHSLYPSDPQQRALVDRYLNFDIGTLYPAIGATIYPTLLHGKEIDPEKVAELNLKLAFLEGFIGNNKYLVGNTLTLGDLTVYASLTMLEIFDHDLSTFPNISGWLLRMRQLPYDAKINREAVVMAKGWAASQKK